MEVLIEYKDVNIKRKNLSIVENLSFSVKKGEVYGLLGHSGSGKTNAIRALLDFGLVKSGEIVINGKCIKSKRRDAFKMMGFILEKPIFYENMTGYENLAYSARLLPNVRRNRILEVIDQLGFKKLKNYKAERYSEYVRQLLNIARGILSNPKILVIDSPTKGLEGEFKAAILEIIDSIVKNDNTTVLLATNSLDEANRLCDHLSIMNKGKVIADGDIDIVLDRENELVQIFTPNPVEAFDLIRKDISDIKHGEKSIRIYSKKESSIEVINKLVNASIPVQYAIPVKLTLDDYITKHAREVKEDAPIATE